MNTQWIAFAAAPALVAPLLLTAGAQPAAGTQPDAGLVRVNPQGGANSAAFDASQWKDRLSARDLEARERDFDRLANELRSNDDARRQVDAWAKDDTNPELAWTSRLLLRAARDGSPGRNWGGFHAVPWNDLRSRFEDLQRGFGGLDSMFEDAQREMERALQGSRSTPPSGGASKSRSQSYSMKVGPDGVDVEVQEDIDGKQETKTYTAKTLDELYAAHPELRDQLGARVEIQRGPTRAFASPRGGFSWFGDDDRTFPGQDPSTRPALPLEPKGMRTDILGVSITPLDADERKGLKLEDGVGLKVERVEPGTIAHKIGVSRGDILVELNGRTLKSTEDVHDTLLARPANQDVSVTLVEPSGKRRTLTWRAAPSGEEPRQF